MTQSPDTGKLATADAAARLLTAIEQAMQTAQASVAKQQDERDQKLAAAHSAQAAGASSRASQVIAGIPGIVQFNTKLALESPGRGERCKATIMRLNAFESEVDPNLCAKDKFNPDPAQLRYAARLVFDFCDRPELGLNPKVVMSVGYDQSSTAYQYLAIEISWQLPVKRS